MVGIAKPAGARTAFTLLELLVVIAIIVMLLALVLPGVISPLRANQLTATGDSLVAEIDAARQTAHLQSSPVTFQFIRVTTGSEVIYPGYRTSLQLPDGTFEQSAITRFPETVVPLEGSIGGNTYETLLTDANAQVTTGAPDPIYPGGAVEYLSFRFFPDGSTDLMPTPSTPTEKWFLTLANITDQLSGTPPTNFVAIVIDPVTGRISKFRP